MVILALWIIKAHGSCSGSKQKLRYSMKIGIFESHNQHQTYMVL